MKQSATQAKRRIAKAKILAEREQASVFIMMRVLAEHPEGLTRGELWAKLVDLSKQEGVDLSTILLVGTNGRLFEYLNRRVELGFVDSDWAISAEDRKFRLTQEGLKHLGDYREEADRLIQKHVHAQLVL